MTKNTTPAVAEPPALPAIYTRDDEITSADVILPKVYLMQDRSTQVKERNARGGDVILATDKDDAGFHFLIGGDEGRESFTAFILDRQRTVARIGDDGDSWEWLPSNYQRRPDERDVWVGFNYLVAIPDVDPFLPAKHLLIKTAGTRVYQKLNTMIQKARALGSPNPVAVKYTTAERVGRDSKQSFYVLIPVEENNPDPDHLAIANQMIAGGARLETFGQSYEETTPVETSSL